MNDKLLIQIKQELEKSFKFPIVEQVRKDLESGEMVYIFRVKVTNATVEELKKFDRQFVDFLKIRNSDLLAENKRVVITSEAA